MTDERRIQQLVEDALSSERTPEEVCREFPDLLPLVRERLALVRGLDRELDALLPDELSEPFARESAETALPRIPGYEVKGLLGRGGMGVVYRARHLRLERDVALKMLLAGEFASPRELERFFREARAIAKLSHPNIVQVHDVSEREGRPYFTMELVEGGTLAQSLAGTPQPASRAAELVSCLADAVEVAHRSGIVHRDLKPANVLLTADGTPKVTDFGLARRMSGGEDLTASGTILGTPSYMAPEQIRGSSVGSAADVYALGAILYEILTGRPPFRTDSALATQMQVLSKDPVRPSVLNNRVPRDLETICLRCLHKEATRRYDSAAELAADLRRFLAHEPIRARPVGRPERALLWGRRNPAKTTMVLVGVVVLCFSASRAVHNQALAKEKSDQEAAWSPRVDGALEQLRSGDLAQARVILDQVPDMLSDELRQRVSEARRELLLVEQLDGIRLRRVTVTEGRFDRSENRHAADLAYDDAFRTAGFGSAGDDPETVAARVKAAAVRLALVGALDDWAFCAGEGPRAAWLLDLARRSDPDPSPWRERFRDPSLRLDKGSTTLAELAEDVQASRMTAQLLIGAAERLRESGGDVIPLLTLVQRAYPGDFWANFALGDVLWMQDPKEAVRYAQAAVAIKPLASIAHQGLGIVLHKAGRDADALEAYRQAVLVEPDLGEAHERLGYTLVSMGQMDEGIRELREAIRLNPDLAMAHQILGAALENTSLLEEAIAEYREAVRLDPRAASMRQSLGNCLVRLKRRREAIEAFQAAVELQDLPAHRSDLGFYLGSLGRFEEAEVQFRKALALDPEFADAKHDLSMVLVSLGRAEEALALYREATRSKPGEVAVWDGYPELCAYLGRTDDYHRVCDELLTRFGNVDEPRDCERLGRACLLLPLESTLPGAVALTERALTASKESDWTRPYFEVAKALAEYRSGRFDSALRILRGNAGNVLAPVSQLIRAMALQHTGAAAEARHNLAAAALSLDWSAAAAGTADSWISHVLRREAEALVLPELADLLAGRKEPEDDDTMAAMSSACVFTAHYAEAARLYESVFGEPSAGWDRNQRYIAARTVARASAGLGVDPADASERAHFRGLVRDWLRADIAECNKFLALDAKKWRANVGLILNPWLDELEFAVVRDPEALAQLPPAEGDECRALWLEVEALAKSVGARD